MSKMGQELQKQIESWIYYDAWIQLHNAFGERMQDEELELMDAVLSGVKADREEFEKWLSEQEGKTDTK